MKDEGEERNFDSETNIPGRGDGSDGGKRCRLDVVSSADLCIVPTKGVYRRAMDTHRNELFD
jgi:hypothetical protein